MTPKEKAIQLVEAMAFSCRECDYESKAKQCALIAIDEILILVTAMDGKEYWQEYYEEVKQEIENL